MSVFLHLKRTVIDALRRNEPIKQIFSVWRIEPIH